MSPSWRLICFRSQTDPQELLQGLPRVIDGGHLSYLEDDRTIVSGEEGGQSPLYSQDYSRPPCLCPHCTGLHPMLPPATSVHFTNPPESNVLFYWRKEKLCLQLSACLHLPLLPLSTQQKSSFSYSWFASVMLTWKESALCIRGTN